MRLTISVTWAMEISLAKNRQYLRNGQTMGTISFLFLNQDVDGRKERERSPAHIAGSQELLSYMYESYYSQEAILD